MAMTIEDLYESMNGTKLPAATPSSGPPTIEDLYEASQSLPDREPTTSSFMHRNVYDPLIGLTKSAVGLPQAAVGLADIAGALSPGKFIQEYLYGNHKGMVKPSQMGKALQELGVDFEKTQEILQEMYSPEYRAQQNKVMRADGIMNKITEAIQNPRTIVGTATESLFPMLAGGSVGKVLRAATKAPAFITGAVGEGLVSAGQTAENIRERSATGELTGEQAGIAATSGAVTGLISMLSGKLADKLGLQTVEAIIAGDGKFQTPRGMLSRLIGGMVTEGLIEELPQSVQEQYATNIATGRPWDEGLADAAAMGLLTGGAIGGVMNLAFGRTAPPPATKPAPTETTEKTTLDPIEAAKKLKKAAEEGTSPEPTIEPEPPSPSPEPEIKSVKLHTEEELVDALEKRKYRPLNEDEELLYKNLQVKKSAGMLSEDEHAEFQLLDRAFQDAYYGSKVTDADIEFGPSLINPNGKKSQFAGLVTSWAKRFGLSNKLIVVTEEDRDWLKAHSIPGVRMYADISPAMDPTKTSLGQAMLSNPGVPYVLVLNMDRMKNTHNFRTRTIIETMGEEFGHIFHKDKWNQLHDLAGKGHRKAKEILRLFDEDYTKYRTKMQSGTADEALKLFNLPAYYEDTLYLTTEEELKGPFSQFSDRAYRNYMLSEAEYIGRGIAKYLTTNEKAVGLLQKWFQSVAREIKEIFSTLSKDYGLPDDFATKFAQFYEKKAAEKKAKKDTSIKIAKALQLVHERTGEVIGYIDKQSWKYLPGYQLRRDIRDPGSPLKAGITPVWAYTSKDGQVEYARRREDAYKRSTNGEIREGTFDKDGNFQERGDILTPEELEVIKDLTLANMVLWHGTSDKNIELLERNGEQLTSGINAENAPKITPEEKSKRAEAKEVAKKLWKNAQEMAKLEQSTPEEYLKKSGLTEDEISAIKKLAKPHKSVFNDTRKAHILARELGWITKDGQEAFDVFKEALIGTRSMKDMTPEEQQKVRLALETLYYEHIKEKIDYKRTSKAQKESDKKIHEGMQTTFDEPSGWGKTREWLWQLFADAEAYLRQSPAGAALFNALKHIQSYGDNTKGRMITLFMKSVEGLTPEECEKALRHHLQEEISTDPRIIQAADTMKGILNELGMRMEELGMEITHFSGKKEKFVFDPDKPYFPHMWDGEELAKKRSNKRAKAVKDMVAKGYAKTPAAAEVLLDKFLARRKNIKYGNMEYARDFDVPGWNRNIKEVIPAYIDKAVTRLLSVEQFGQDMKGLNELLGGLRKERGHNGEYAAKYGESVAKRVMGYHFFVSDVEQHVISAITTFEVWSKLGLFAVTNATQPVNTYMRTNAKTFARGLLALLKDPKGTAEFAYRIGATLHLFLNEYSEYQKGNIISNTLLNAGDRYGSPLMKKLGEKAGGTSSAGLFLKMVGGTHVEIFNRVLTAAIGREFTVDLVNQLLTSEVGSSRYEQALNKLKLLRVDTDSIRINGQATEYDIQAASLELVRQTQFVNDALTLPRWMGENPWAKLLFLFQTFGYQQTKLIKQVIQHDRGRIVPGLVAMGLVGFLANSAQRLLRGKDEDREWYEIAMDAIASAGGFGMAMNAIQTMFQDGGVYKFLGGVVLSDAEKYRKAVMQGMKDVADGEYTFELLQKRLIGDIPVVGRTLANKLYD